MRSGYAPTTTANQTAFTTTDRATTHATGRRPSRARRTFGSRTREGTSAQTRRSSTPTERTRTGENNSAAPPPTAPRAFPLSAAAACGHADHLSTVDRVSADDLSLSSRARFIVGGVVAAATECRATRAGRAVRAGHVDHVTHVGRGARTGHAGHVGRVVRAWWGGRAIRDAFRSSSGFSAGPKESAGNGVGLSMDARRALFRPSVEDPPLAASGRARL